MSIKTYVLISTEINAELKTPAVAYALMRHFAERADNQPNKLEIYDTALEAVVAFENKSAGELAAIEMIAGDFELATGGPADNYAKQMAAEKLEKYLLEDQTKASAGHVLIALKNAFELTDVELGLLGPGIEPRVARIPRAELFTYSPVVDTRVSHILA